MTSDNPSAAKSPNSFNSLRIRYHGHQIYLILLSHLSFLLSSVHQWEIPQSLVVANSQEILRLQAHKVYYQKQVSLLLLQRICLNDQLSLCPSSGLAIFTSHKVDLCAFLPSLHFFSCFPESRCIASLFKFLLSTSSFSFLQSHVT